MHINLKKIKQKQMFNVGIDMDSHGEYLEVGN